MSPTLAFDMIVAAYENVVGTGCQDGIVVSVVAICCYIVDLCCLSSGCCVDCFVLINFYHGGKTLK